eukprot:CAMPEP_0204537126 /NCGR_PEP_ID=MMETSP0661-20131031/14991_1 /ASSEMBLY_ACC=CAM_ASM_000606 /TAXON_ID=109239 /ORGANISM="Alexandrium margalefi, Strain AMGDE01CS-322" /LENGTH=122 /DNA_ID=CAMNT_0051543671 /DNA_START=28 /DNA_END=393 /DNA_ORIENTATION=-
MTAGGCPAAAGAVNGGGRGRGAAVPPPRVMRARPPAPPPPSDLAADIKGVSPVGPRLPEAAQRLGPVPAQRKHSAAPVQAVRGQVGAPPRQASAERRQLRHEGQGLLDVAEVEEHDAAEDLR